MLVFMCVALPILATTPLGHCCKQEYALSQAAWLNKDEREVAPTGRPAKVLLFSGAVYLTAIHLQCSTSYHSFNFGFVTSGGPLFLYVC